MYLHVLIELELITFYLQTISIYTKATFTKVFEQTISSTTFSMGFMEEHRRGEGRGGGT